MTNCQQCGALVYLDTKGRLRDMETHVVHVCRHKMLRAS